MIEEWDGVLHTLTGMENNSEKNVTKGIINNFNFIMSNGKRTSQRDEGKKYYTHMMPADKKIRSVAIHHINGNITGFQFFDKEITPNNIF